MKLVIDESVHTIKAYEYRDRDDIEEVVIPDSVETIGEGAFRHCVELQKVTVGRGLKHISTFAFYGIKKDADIIWLCQLPYKSKLITILPPFDRIRSLCAPCQSFDRATNDEKRLLACGYILHPELENEYSLSLQAQYQQYIQEELPHYLNELCENGSILDIFLSCRKRQLIKDKEVMKQYIAYIRTKKMTKEEKTVIDHIEQVENLLQQEDIKEDQTNDKKLLRYIADHVTQSELRQVFLNEGLDKFPQVKYKNSIKNAPVEALKYIMYSYMSQWSYMNTKPPMFHFDQSADYVASLLDMSSLQDALQQLSCVFIEYLTWGKHITILYPRRLIPLLRYASQSQTQSWIQKAQDWLNYDVYGQEGSIAYETLKQAVLLNDSSYAMLFANRCELLKQYALLRHCNEEEMLMSLVKILESKEIDSDDDLKQIQIQYQQKLYLDYLSGKKFMKKDWYQWNMTLPTLKALAMTLVWQKNDETYFIMSLKGAMDENHQLVSLEDESMISIAHPVFMRDDQIRSFEKYFKNNHIQQCFLQIKPMAVRFIPDEWESWKSRYFGIVTPASKLQTLGQKGFHLDGRPAEYLRISFNGKVIMEVFPVSHKQEKDPMMSLGDLQNSNYNIRELSEVIFMMDDVLYMEMIALGKLDVSLYLHRLSEDDVDDLLEASIERKHHENSAILLEYKSKMFHKKDDFTLDW